MLPAARPRPAEPPAPRSARRPSGRGEKGSGKPPRSRSAPIELARRRLGHPPPPNASRGAAGLWGPGVGLCVSQAPPFPTHTHLGSISSADLGTPATHVTLIPPPASSGSCGGMHPPHPQPNPLGGPGMGDGEGSADIHARSWGASVRGDNLQAGRRAAWQPAALTRMDLAGGCSSPSWGAWPCGTRFPLSPLVLTPAPAWKLVLSWP